MTDTRFQRAVRVALITRPASLRVMAAASRLVSLIPGTIHAAARKAAPRLRDSMTARWAVERYTLTLSVPVLDRQERWVELTAPVVWDAAVIQIAMVVLSATTVIAKLWNARHQMIPARIMSVTAITAAISLITTAAVTPTLIAARAGILALRTYARMDSALLSSRAIATRSAETLSAASPIFRVVASMEKSPLAQCRRRITRADVLRRITTVLWKLTTTRGITGAPAAVNLVLRYAEVAVGTALPEIHAPTSLRPRHVIFARPTAKAASACVAPPSLSLDKQHIGGCAESVCRCV